MKPRFRPGQRVTVSIEAEIRALSSKSAELSLGGHFLIKRENCVALVVPIERLSGIGPRPRRRK